MKKLRAFLTYIYFKTIVKLYVYLVYRLFSFKIEKKFPVYCLNLGFHDDQINNLKLRPEHENERLQFQLYHYLIKDISIDNKDLLEIGCGIGGGCYYYDTYFEPRSIRGIDISEKHISIAKEKFKDSTINFTVGDASKLDMKHASADVIVNLESSHSYSDFPNLIREVFLILKPGAYLTFADVRLTGDLEKLKSTFNEIGFSIKKQENITKGVCSSLILDKDRKEKIVGKDWISKKLFSNLSFLEGSKNYRFLMENKTNYFYFLLQKPHNSSN